jgi:hypothetical protein
MMTSVRRASRSLPSRPTIVFNMAKCTMAIVVAILGMQGESIPCHLPPTWPTLHFAYSPRVYRHTLVCLTHRHWCCHVGHKVHHLQPQPISLPKQGSWCLEHQSRPTSRAIMVATPSCSQTSTPAKESILWQGGQFQPATPHSRRT